MCQIERKKVERTRADITTPELFGDADGLLVVSWGGTFGSVRTAVEEARAEGVRCGHLHLRWLNPLPLNLRSLGLSQPKCTDCGGSILANCGDTCVGSTS